MLDGSGSANGTIAIPAINFSDTPGGTEGHFVGDAAFPGTVSDNFVIEADVSFYVSPQQVGTWTFGVRSDDGNRLRVDGLTILTDDATHAPLDSFSTVTLTAGLHTLNLTYFERLSGASLELFAAAGTHTAFNGSFQLFDDSLFYLYGDFALRTRASDIAVSSLATADALLAEPYHNVVDFFYENSNANLLLAPATAGDQDGVADGVVGPYQFSATEYGVMEKRRMAIAAADADFDFSIYDTNPANGVISPDELVVVIMGGQDDGNNHIGFFRQLSEFVPGSIQQFNVVDPTSTLPYVAERGQISGQTGLFDYRNVYYAHSHPTQSNWTNGQATNHFLQSSVQHTITGATNTNPIVINSANHGLATGDLVFINGVGGNTRANGSWKITRIDANQFSLDGREGNGTYTGGGTWVEGKYAPAGALGNIRQTDIAVVTDDGVTIPSGFQAAMIEQWVSVITTYHEISHLLHPDAKDIYNYEANGVQAEINYYATMGVSGSGVYHHDPWTKSRLGWITPTTISTPTTVVLADVATSGQVLKVPRPGNPQEYILIENRWGGTSYDATTHAQTVTPGLPATGVADEGIAIWHVDESRLAAFNSNDFTAPAFLAKEDASNTPSNRNDDLFDGTTDYHALTTPSSAWNDGIASDVVVTAISPPGPNVTLQIDFSGVPRDRLESNDSFEFAYPVGSGDQTYEELTIHRSNDDYYRWTAPATGTVDIDILFDHAGGDVDASLHLDDTTHTLVTSSTSANDNEQISASVTAGQQYLVRVYGYAGAMNDAYDLVIDGPDAIGDRLEVNNSFAEATSLGTGGATELGLSIHDSSDEDYFRWYAPAAGFFQANIIFEHSQGDLDLFLYDQNFDLVGSSTSTNDDEAIQIASVIPYQPYYVLVDGYNGAINSSYGLGIVSPAIPADFLEPNDSFEFARNLGMGDLAQSHLTIHTANNDDYYRWRAPATGWLTADLEFLHEVGDLDLNVYDSNAMLLTTSTSTTDNEQIELNVQKGDYYTFRVTGYASAVHHDYQLTLDGPEIQDDRFEVNDDFGTATELLGQDQIQDELTIHAANNDDYYRWVAPADGQLMLNLYFEDSAGDLDLYLYDAPEFDSQIASSTSTTDFEQIAVPVAAFQEYFLQVDGHLGATNFDYAFSIDGPDPPSADFDVDGDVDGADFLAWQRGFGTPMPLATKPDGDADNDTDVDGRDLAVWEGQFGQIVSPLLATSMSTDSVSRPAIPATVLSVQKPLAVAELIDAALMLALPSHVGVEEESALLDRPTFFEMPTYETAIGSGHFAPASLLADESELLAVSSQKVDEVEDQWLTDELLEQVFS
jgi:M6 family metalloprotease-like protein